MSARRFREWFVLTLPVALAGLVFYLTRDATAAGNGHTSPGAFPRLVAGVMGGFAFIRIFMPITPDQSPEHGELWAWAPFCKSMAAAGCMVVYILLFAKLAFLPLTLVFLFVIFLIFDVRPVLRAGLSAAIATGLLYVLFIYILGIAV